MTKGRLRVISLTNTLLRYKPSLGLQEGLVAERKAGTAPDTLLIVQVGSQGAECSLMAASKRALGSPQRLVPVLAIELLAGLGCWCLLYCSTTLCSPSASAAHTRIS